MGSGLWSSVHLHHDNDLSDGWYRIWCRGNGSFSRQIRSTSCLHHCQCVGPIVFDCTSASHKLAAFCSHSFRHWFLRWWVEDNDTELMLYIKNTLCIFYTYKGFYGLLLYFFFFEACSEGPKQQFDASPLARVMAWQHQAQAIPWTNVDQHEWYRQ